MYKVFLAGFHEFKYKHSIENLRKSCPRKAQKRDKAKPKKIRHFWPGLVTIIRER